MKRTIYLRHTIYFGTFSGNIKCRFHVANDSHTLAPDHLLSFTCAHFGIIHGVDHLPIKYFWTFTCWECGYVGHTTEHPYAQNDKVCFVCLHKGKNQVLDYYTTVLCM